MIFHVVTAFLVGKYILAILDRNCSRKYKKPSNIRLLLQRLISGKTGEHSTKRFSGVVCVRICVPEAGIYIQGMDS